jgi:hypothetical protein
VANQRRSVVGHLLVGEWAINVGGAPVPLLLGRDHLPCRRQPGQHRAHHVDRHVGAVQDEQRPARPVDLVIHAEIADRHVAAACLDARHRPAIPPVSVEVSSMALRTISPLVIRLHSCSTSLEVRLGQEQAVTANMPQPAAAIAFALLALAAVALALALGARRAIVAG